MNTKTQKLVFSKMTNQKLGAIEDAIQQAKQDLADKGAELLNLKDTLKDRSENIRDQAKSLSEDLLNSMMEVGGQWNDRLDEFNQLASELENLGIDYNINIDAISNDYLEIYDAADNLIFNLGN
jgi:ABC-type transporter Mla subunit MlaD